MTLPAPTAVDPSVTRAPAALRPASAVLAACLLGIAAGAATGWLQGRLSGSWHVLADSGAVWTALAFVAAALCATLTPSRRLAVVVGTLTLLGEVAGYYVLAAHALGFDATVQEQVVWTVAALWIGPLTGVAGHAWRRGGWRAAAAAVLGLAGVAAGEGLHELVRLHDHAAGTAELAAAVVLAATVLLSHRRSTPLDRVTALAVGMLVCLVTWAAYGTAVGG